MFAWPLDLRKMAKQKFSGVSNVSSDHRERNGSVVECLTRDNMQTMRQSACLGVNPIMVDSCGFF